MLDSPFDHEFDSLVNDELAKWKVPGLTIFVVHGENNTYSKVSPSPFRTPSHNT